MREANVITSCPFCVFHPAFEVVFHCKLNTEEYLLQLQIIMLDSAIGWTYALLPTQNVGITLEHTEAGFTMATPTYLPNIVLSGIGFWILLFLDKIMIQNRETAEQVRSNG